MAGERCDVPTYEWINDNLRVLINDNYWQTEAGWIISCNYKVKAQNALAVKKKIHTKLSKIAFLFLD